MLIKPVTFVGTCGAGNYTEKDVMEKDTYKDTLVCHYNIFLKGQGLFNYFLLEIYMLLKGLFGLLVYLEETKNFRLFVQSV